MAAAAIACNPHWKEVVKHVATRHRHFIYINLQPRHRHSHQVENKKKKTWIFSYLHSRGASTLFLIDTVKRKRRGNESERQIRNLSQQLEVAGLSSSREEMEIANIPAKNLQKGLGGSHEEVQVSI